MECRRRWAVDDDRSSRWVIDEDRYPRRQAVDDDRSRIAYYQAQTKVSLDRIDKNLNRIDKNLRAIRKMRMSSATIPEYSSSSSFLSFASRKRHQSRVKPTVSDYPPLELPLRWRNPPPFHYPPLELPLKWRNPLPDHLIHNQPATFVRDSSLLRPHFSTHDSASASSRDQNLNTASSHDHTHDPDPLQQDSAADTSLTLKPAIPASFLCSSNQKAQTSLLQCDPSVADIDFIQGAMFRSDPPTEPPPSLQCNPKVSTEPEEAATDSNIFEEERFIRSPLTLDSDTSARNRPSNRAPTITPTPEAVAKSLLPVLQARFDKTPNTFDSYEDVLKLHEGGLPLPYIPHVQALMQTIPIEMLKSILTPTTGSPQPDCASASAPSRVPRQLPSSATSDLPTSPNIFLISAMALQEPRPAHHASTASANETEQPLAPQQLKTGQINPVLIQKPEKMKTDSSPISPSSALFKPLQGPASTRSSTSSHPPPPQKLIQENLAHSEENHFASTELKFAEVWPGIKREFKKKLAMYGCEIASGGIEDVSVAGVQMLDVNFNNKADQMQCSQDVRQNVSKGSDSKFLGPRIPMARPAFCASSIRPNNPLRHGRWSIYFSWHFENDGLALVRVLEACSFVNVMDDSIRVYERLMESDIVARTSVVFEYLQNGVAEKAITFFFKIFDPGI